MPKNVFDEIISNNFNERSKEHARQAQALRKENEHKAIANKVKNQLINSSTITNATKLKQANYIKPTIGKNYSVYLSSEALDKINIWKEKNYNISKIINDLIIKTNI